MFQKQPQGSRGDKRQYRRPARPGGSSRPAQPQKHYQRVISAAKVDSGGGDTGIPSTSSSSPTSSNTTATTFTNNATAATSSSIYKKSDGQGTQSSDQSGTTAGTNSASTVVENVTPSESSASATFDVQSSEASLKQYPNDSRICPTDCKALCSEPAPRTSESATFKTFVRDGTSREVPLQFGSFTPGFVNGMKIPPRTNSAPPNLDEQRRKQENLSSSSPEKTALTFSASSRLQPRLDVNQSKNEVFPSETQPKRDIRSHLPASVATGTMSSCIPPSGMPMPHQPPHIPVQYGIPGPQIQAQGVPPTSLQMPMPLPVGHPGQARQPAFVPGLHPQPIPPQGLMHQGQGFNFFPQIGHQFPPQFGSSVGVSPQFPQHHIRNSSPRRAVKITNPKTNEELKLDEKIDYKLDTCSSGPGSHIMGFQMHPIAYDHSHPMNNFPHVHHAPVILQSPPSFPAVSSPVPSNLWFNSSVRSNGGLNNEKNLDFSESLSSAFNERSQLRSWRLPSIVNSRKGESKFLPAAASSIKLPKISVDFTSQSSSVSLDRAPVSDSAFINLTHDEKSTTQMKVNGKRKMPSKKDVQAETSDFVESSTKLPMEKNDCIDKVTHTVKQAEPSISGWKVGESFSKCANLEIKASMGDTTPSETHGNFVEGNSDTQVRNRASGEGPGVDSSNMIVVVEEKEQNMSSHRSTSEVNNGFPEETEDNMSEHLGSRNDNEQKNINSLKSLKAKEKTEMGLNTKETSSWKEHAALKLDENIQGKSVTGSSETDNPSISCIENNVSEAGLSSPVSLTDRSEVRSVTVGASESGSGPMGDGDLIPSSMAEKNASKSGLKSTPTASRVKSATSKGKKKRKEILQKADAAGSTSDLFMAFKAPKKKSESSIFPERIGNASRPNSKQTSSVSTERDIPAKDGLSKLIQDDWEDVADSETPKLEYRNKTGVAQLRDVEVDGRGPMEKKMYSRDFLLTISANVSILPSDFKMSYELGEALLDPKAKVPTDLDNNLNFVCEQYAEKLSGVYWPDGHGTEFADDGKWSKSSASLSSGFDPRIDVSHEGNTFGFRGQGGSCGSFRNPRGQISELLHFASQGGIQRCGPDANRWQLASGVQKVFSQVKTSLLFIHKAEKKYEVRKVTDSEEAKHRQLKAILNKLTPQNFERLFEQVKEVNIDNAVTLGGVIAQIFDKALMEPTFCEMYANFCYHLAGELPDFIEDNQKITFKRLLLNKCQEEFERGEREQAEADREEGEGEIKQTDQEREEKRICVRRRMLGNIRLIGELYKKKMLTERIMHECIQKLLGQYQNPDEEDIEALCKLMSTIGEMIDHSKAKEYMDAYFDIMANMSNNMKLSSRVRFMLKDVIDLRENKWKQRRKVEGPKKIEDLHRDAAQERHANRMTRGPSFTNTSRRGQASEFGPRASTIFSSPSPQIGYVRGLPSQVRGLGNQDVRLEDRPHSDNRVLHIPLSHRPMDTQTSLGPQGGLSRGMAARGTPMLSGPPPIDVQTSFGDCRRMPASMNGHNSLTEWAPSKQEARYGQENCTRPSGYSQPHQQGYMHPSSREPVNPGHSGRSVATHTQKSVTSSVSSGKARCAEILSEMSMAAIREFYSAGDENEVVNCIKDLDNPSFHPAMVSLWVNDSFERKDRDRDLLLKLLVNLTKSAKGILELDQLAEGFQMVLNTLDDAVTDAPKAATYLGDYFGRIIIENVISLRGIDRLLQQGGGQPGCLVQNGLGYEVLESALEVIKLKKGDSALNEICRSSNVWLEDYRPSLES